MANDILKFKKKDKSPLYPFTNFKAVVDENGRDLDTTVKVIKEDVQCIKVKNYFDAQLDSSSGLYKVIINGPEENDKDTRYEILSVSAKDLNAGDDYIVIDSNGVSGSFGDVLSLADDADDVILYQTGGDKTKSSALYYGYDRVDFIHSKFERHCKVLQISDFISSLPAKDASGTATFAWTGSSGNGRLQIRISSIMEAYPDLYMTLNNVQWDNKLCEVSQKNSVLSSKKGSSTNVFIDGFKNIEGETFANYSQCVNYLKQQSFKIVLKLAEPVITSIEDMGIELKSFEFERKKGESAWVEFSDPQGNTSGCVELAYLSSNDYIYTKDQIDEKFYNKSQIDASLAELAEKHDVFVASYGNTTWSEISDAFDEGKIIVVKFEWGSGNFYFYMTDSNIDAGYLYFSAYTNEPFAFNDEEFEPGHYLISINDLDVWSFCGETGHFVNGKGENSVQQKGTGARAIGAESVAEGHGEIQRSQGVITRDGSEIIDEVSYPKYRVDYVNDDPEKLRVGQTISLNGNGESLRKIIKLTTVSDYRDDILLDSAFIPDALGEDTLFIVTGVSYGNHSHIEGNGCFSLSNSSHAEGTGSVALGKYAHAEGLETLAEGSRSHAEGAWTKAIKDEAHAEGQYSEARARASHAEGYKSVTSKEGYSSNTLEPHAQGTGTSSWVNGISHAEGNATIAQGLGAHAEGEKTFANNRTAHAEGLETVASGDYASHAEGEATIASGEDSHAEGFKTKAAALASHTEGNRTVINEGGRSHTEGYGTYATGVGAHSEGINGYFIVLQRNGSSGNVYNIRQIENMTPAEALAAGKYPKVGDLNAEDSKSIKSVDTANHRITMSGNWGGNNKWHRQYFIINDIEDTSLRNNDGALGFATHAEGVHTKANGWGSHAEGEMSIANGATSHVEGWRTKTENQCEHAQGQYNVSHKASGTFGDAGNTIHSVGIGNRTDEYGNGNHKNAFEIMQNGDAYLYGVGGYDGTNPANAKTLQEFIGGLEEITYATLVSKRNNSQLVPCRWYRITDYITTTTQENTRSAGNQFDVIVLATDVNKLSEEARAIVHAGDTYFTNASADIEGWKIWYCLDNDINRFLWADATNGKGVIYRMIDEWGNDCPYDFKNIQFKRYKITACINSPDLVGLYGITDNGGKYTVDSSNPYWTYTFCMIDTNDDTPHDVTVEQDAYFSDEGYCYKNHDNVFKPYYYDDYDREPILELMSLPNNCMVTDTDICCIEDEYGEFYGFYNNKFEGGCHNNTFGNDCGNNTFGNDCYWNTFGNTFQSNTFGNNCYSNTFGNNCGSNTFGNDCGNNTFGNGVYNNTFGNNCGSNTFGNDCGNNTFGNDCYRNTFGNNCYSNTFGNDCYWNTFGNDCWNNTFGNNCNYNQFGNGVYNNTFGNNCNNIIINKDYIYYIIVENGNQYITITSTQTTSSANMLRNFTIAQGVNNTSTRKTISHNTVADTFKTTYQNANSTTVDV